MTLAEDFVRVLSNKMQKTISKCSSDWLGNLNFVCMKDKNILSSRVWLLTWRTRLTIVFESLHYRYKQCCILIFVCSLSLWTANSMEIEFVKRDNVSHSDTLWKGLIISPDAVRQRTLQPFMIPIIDHVQVWNKSYYKLSHAINHVITTWYSSLSLNQSNSSFFVRH